jgi:hypothetical protein
MALRPDGAWHALDRNAFTDDACCNPSGSTSNTTGGFQAAIDQNKKSDTARPDTNTMKPSTFEIRKRNIFFLLLLLCEA